MSQTAAKTPEEGNESKLSPKEKESSENTAEKPNTETASEVSNGKEHGTSEGLRRTPRKTKSRSATPLIKANVEKIENDTETNTLDTTSEENEDEPEKLEISDDNTEVNPINGKTNGEENVNKTEETDDTESSQDEKASEEVNTGDEFIADSESFMDPLVLQADEPCAELEFEECSDKDSGKYSPIISRCTTRRSQSRNIPTPKTPRSLDEQESEKGTTPAATPEPEDLAKNSLLKDLNETDNSSNTDNLSTKAQVGGDTTRFDFSEGDSDFLSSLKSKENCSFPRYISSRRSIRPLSDSIRKKSLKNSTQRANLSIPFFSSRDSVERAPSVKRKSRSETPEDRKRFKNNSPGFMAKIASPLTSLKHKFTGVPNSTSTPKLTSYRDQRNHLGGDFFDQMPDKAADQQNKWCSIM